MIIGKYLVTDFIKLMERIRSSRRATTLMVQLDGPTLKVSFEDDLGKNITVNIYDESVRTNPTVTRTESL